MTSARIKTNKQKIVFALQRAGVGVLGPEWTKRNEQRGNTGSFCTKKIRLESGFVRVAKYFVYVSLFFGLPFELKLTTFLYFQITYSLLF